MTTGLLIALLGAVVSFVLGWVWYSKFLFGKFWMAEMGITAEPTKAEKMAMMPKMLGFGLLADFVKSFVFLILVATLRANQFYLGAFIWLGFVVPMLLNAVLYEKKSWKLFLIHAGYYLVSIMAIGFVFSFF